MPCLLVFNIFFWTFCFKFCSVMYILCNEEPLWMNLFLRSAGGLLEYKGSWKETALCQYVYLAWVLLCSELWIWTLESANWHYIELWIHLYIYFFILAIFQIEGCFLFRRQNLFVEFSKSSREMHFDGNVPLYFWGLLAIAFWRNFSAFKK